MNEQSAKKPAPEPVKVARLPKAGDEVRFVGYSRTAEPQYAIIAKVYGLSTVNLGYLSESGVWFSSTSVRYSEDRTEGTWHWPGPRG